MTYIPELALRIPTALPLPEPALRLPIPELARRLRLSAHPGAGHYGRHRAVPIPDGKRQSRDISRMAAKI
jgi:hypothetical protein